MTISLKTTLLCLGLGISLTACGGSNLGSLGGNSSAGSAGSAGGTAGQKTIIEKEREEEANRAKLGDLFVQNRDGEIGSVNKYLWHASLDVLSFLPIESADPFSGVIVFGNGRAPGSSSVFRATVLVTGPALDARELKVSVSSSRGAASAETQRQIENAILSRARQLRISRAKL